MLLPRAAAFPGLSWEASRHPPRTPRAQALRGLLVLDLVLVHDPDVLQRVAGYRDEIGGMEADGVGILAVCDGTSGEIVGKAGLILGWKDLVEPVAFFRASHTKAGGSERKYGTNLLGHLIDQAFELPDVSRVVSTIDESNDAAIGLATKVGMRLIGEREDRLPNEEPKLVYGFGRTDWERKGRKRLWGRLEADDRVLRVEQRSASRRSGSRPWRASV